MDQPAAGWFPDPSGQRGVRTYPEWFRKAARIVLEAINE